MYETEGNKNEKERVFLAKKTRKRREKLWKNHELIAAEKRLQNIINMTLDNVIFFDTKTNGKALNKGILRCKFMHIHNEKKHFIQFFPKQGKKNLFIQFLCCFICFHEIVSYFL
jgi:hypothetical protein